MSEVLIVPDAAQAAEAAAELFVESVVGSVAARGRALVALTGGSSAPKMYAALRQKPWVERVPWNKLELMVGDDRCVPETDVRSNWGVAQKELFSKVPIDPLRLHRMRCEAADAEAEAERFEAELRMLAGTPPRLDLILLGLGPDGHIFSLFAGVAESAVRDERLIRAVAAPLHNEPVVPRITFSPALLVTARTVVLQAIGASKAVSLTKAVRGADDLVNCPAQWLRRAAGRVVVIADSAAAANL